jgi:hypothetical protein
MAHIDDETGLETFDSTERLCSRMKMWIAQAYDRSYSQMEDADPFKAAVARIEHENICLDLATQGIAEPKYRGALYRDEWERERDRENSLDLDNHYRKY